MRVQILLFPGFDELDAFAPFEVLQNAAKQGASVTTEYVTPDGDEDIKAGHGTVVRVQRSLDAGTTPDLLVVPGGGWNGHAAQGVRAEALRGVLPPLIARLHGSGTVIAGICTGVMLLSVAGLTQGRPATTHQGAVEELRQSGAEIVQARVVDDGDIVTSGGVTSGLDLSLWLVERFFGPQIALSIEQNLEYERRGTVWRRHTPQELTL